MITSINHGSYTLKNIRTFKGMEGMGGFNATLYRDGIKIGEVINDDSGGPNCYHIPANELKTLTEYAASVYRDIEFEVEDMFVNTLIDDYLEHKRLSKYCKKETVYRLKGDEKGSYRRINHIFDNEVKAYITKKYGDEIEMIVNEVI